MKGGYNLQMDVISKKSNDFKIVTKFELAIKIGTNNNVDTNCDL